jgi:hypothetical protein
MVKTGAPLLSRADDDEHVVGHYCKDHAGLVCAAAGFYWRDGRGKSGVWVQFDGE